MADAGADATDGSVASVGEPVRSKASVVPEAGLLAELVLAEVQVGGGAQAAVGELQPQRLIDADAIAATGTHE
jgi:hypothetical protein